MSIISTAIRTLFPALAFFHLADLQPIPRKKQSHTLPKSYMCRTKLTCRTHYRKEGTMILRTRGHKLLPLDNVFSMTRKLHLWFISNKLEWQDLQDDNNMPTQRGNTTMYHNAPLLDEELQTVNGCWGEE